LSKQYFAGIDLVRFIAAALVMVFHLGAYGWLRPGADAFRIIGLEQPISPPMPTFWFGWVGVQIFFVISGVVIANSARNRSPIDFIKGRALRLYPVAILAAAISLTVSIAFGLDSGMTLLRKAAASFLLLPIGPWLDTVFWTLAVEMAFYLLVTIWLTLGLSNRLHQLAYGLILISASYWIAYAFAGTPVVSYLVRNLLLLHHGCYFGLGILCWSVLKISPNALDFVMIAIAAITCFWEIAVLAWSPSPLAAIGGATVPILIWASSILAIVISLKVQFPESFAYYLRILGLATFPLYLLHHPIGGTATRWSLEIGLSVTTAAAVGIGVTIIASLFVSYFLEPVLRRVMKKAINMASSTNPRMA